MTRKRKKRAAARAKRRRESLELEQPVEPPTPAEEWSEVVDSFREMLQLEGGARELLSGGADQRATTWPGPSLSPVSDL